MSTAPQPLPSPSRHLLVDSSNIFLMLRRAAGLPGGRADTRTRLNVTGLVDVLGARHANKTLYCSYRAGMEPSAPEERLWSAFQGEGFRLSKHARGADGKEKEVDTQIVADMVKLAFSSCGSVELTLVSGDRDMLPGIRTALESPLCRVTVCSLVSGMCAELRTMEAAYPGRLSVRTLDSDLGAIATKQWLLKHPAPLLASSAPGVWLQLGAGAAEQRLHGLQLSNYLSDVLGVSVRVMPAPSSLAWVAVAEAERGWPDVSQCVSCFRGLLANPHSQLRKWGFQTVRQALAADVDERPRGLDAAACATDSDATSTTDSDAASSSEPDAPRRGAGFVPHIPCWHKAACKMKLRCTFLHTPSELEYFKSLRR